MKRVHIIGIGGSGLSAIAMVLLEQGFIVTGSDRQASILTRGLEEAGAEVYIGHDPDNVIGAELVLRSSAVPDENVEVQGAISLGIPVLKRIDFLPQLLTGKKSIAVAGTHGKTTTTAMIAWALSFLGLEPSYVIGSHSIDLGRNAHAGRGSFFVIEADEYDRMFLGLSPWIAVVTNVEHDHPDCYPTQKEFFQAFRDFIARVEPDGFLACCGDDPGAATLWLEAKSGTRQVVSYGITSQDYDYWASDLDINKSGGFSFNVYNRAGVRLVSASLRVPGKHNVLNALATLAVMDLMGQPLDAAAGALAEFRGAERRFEVRGEIAGITVIDDYAHHPTEIRVTLAAARTRYPGQKIWAVWQPHTFSRVQTLLADYKSAFQDADHVLVTDIYAAREIEPEDGFSSRQIVDFMLSDNRQGKPDVRFTPRFDRVIDYLLEYLLPGDVVLVLSAGDANRISSELIQILSRRNLSTA